MSARKASETPRMGSGGAWGTESRRETALAAVVDIFRDEEKRWSDDVDEDGEDGGEDGENTALFLTDATCCDIFLYETETGAVLSKPVRAGKEQIKPPLRAMRGRIGQGCSVAKSSIDERAKRVGGFSESQFFLTRSLVRTHLAQPADTATAELARVHERAEGRLKWLRSRRAGRFVVVVAF